MENKLVIVLLPVEFYDRKVDAEQFEDTNFNDIDEIKFYFSNEEVCIYMSMSDFMDDFNDVEFDSNKYWLTYVNIIS